MIAVSNEFKSLMRKRTDFKENAVITLSDGTVLNLTESDFTVSNNSITDAAGANGLPLGVAISRSIQIELANQDDHLSGYDFFGATIRLYLTFELSKTTEKIEMGTFTVITPETYGETAIITANDDMWKADKPYTTALSFPAALSNIFRDACANCGIPFYTTNFQNSNFSVESKPDEDYTYREIIGYIAMIAGGNARVSRTGYMEIIPYDFTDYSRAHDLKDWSSLRTDTEDIRVTGIQTKIKKGAVLEGTEGYVLSIENPLIAGKEAEALKLIGAPLIGKSFRKFEGDYVGYPIAEFMDLVKITDRKGNVFHSVVTDINFLFFGFTTMANSAESAIRSASTYKTPAGEAIIAARELVNTERTERETAILQLNKLLTESSGLYSTEETQEDGSKIYYLHDKPTIAGSKNVMKLTAEAIGFSTDGGKTYPFGFTVTGDMIAKILAAEGINADWIKVGKMSMDRIDGLSSRFEVMEDGILSSVENNYSKKDETDLRFENLSTEFRQTAESFELQFNQIEKDTGDRFNEISKYIRFVDGNIILGENGNRISLQIENDRIRFFDNGSEVAYLSNNKLYITDGNFLNSIRIGKFAWIPRGNGNLSLVKVGD